MIFPPHDPDKQLVATAGLIGGCAIGIALLLLAALAAVCLTGCASLKWWLSDW